MKVLILLPSELDKLLFGFETVEICKDVPFPRRNVVDLVLFLFSVTIEEMEDMFIALDTSFEIVVIVILSFR